MDYLIDKLLQPTLNTKISDGDSTPSEINKCNLALKGGILELDKE